MEDHISEIIIIKKFLQKKLDNGTIGEMKKLFIPLILDATIKIKIIINSQ